MGKRRSDEDIAFDIVFLIIALCGFLGGLIAFYLGYFEWAVMLTLWAIYLKPK